MKRRAYALLGLILFVAAGLAVPAAPAGRKDTAGTRLMDVWRKARSKFYDALLISISGRTIAAGTPFCSMRAPFQNGWRYSFYSPEKDKYLMMAECGGAIAGPLVQMRESSASKFPISGKFIDSDIALRALGRMGVPLDPRKYKAGGRRPFSLKLYRIEDKRFKSHPAVWKIRIGKKFFLVDAVYNERLSPKRYGVINTVDLSTGGVYASHILSKRPKRKGVYTVRKDLEKVLRYGRKKFPGSSLMAIEGFIDAWGGSPCTGPGDGWAFYFYYPKNRGFEVVYACNGFIGPGPTQYIPVDLNKHKAISGPFIDSDKLMDSLIIHHPDSMNEGMGRSFKRNGTALLLNYRTSPFIGSDHWNVSLVWRTRVGRTDFLFDARNGRLLKVSEQ